MNNIQKPATRGSQPGSDRETIDSLGGLLLIDKPSGMTSHDVVYKVRKKLGGLKTGHGGTLDPLATGLLLLLLGPGTKLSARMSGLNKSYLATMKLGAETKTHDREGEEQPAGEDTALPGLPELREALRSFTGRIQQIPPMYSAKKVHGKRLYLLARKGSVVERDAKEVEIFSMDLIDYTPPFVRLFVTCSKGTYIRSLCRDIGRRLGCGAYLWDLQRNEVGPFSLDKAFALDAFLAMNEGEIAEKVISMDTARKMIEETT